LTTGLSSTTGLSEGDSLRGITSGEQERRPKERETMEITLNNFLRHLMIDSSWEAVSFG
jgi:hypothetical protein